MVTIGSNEHPDMHLRLATLKAKKLQLVFVYSSCHSQKIEAIFFGPNDAFSQSVDFSLQH